MHRDYCAINCPLGCLGDYIELGRPVNFYTVVETVRRRGQTDLGYRLEAEADGFDSNPKKSGMVTFYTRRQSHRTGRRLDTPGYI